MISIVYRRMTHAEGLQLPAYKSEDAAGMDLVAALPADGEVVLAPGAWALIPTGLAIELPKGFEAQIRPRSGLALHDGVTVLNSPGTVDADYRGEIGVILINFGNKPFAVRRGARIAQLVVCSVERVALIAGERLTSSARGSKDSAPPGAHRRRYEYEPIIATERSRHRRRCRCRVALSVCAGRGEGPRGAPQAAAAPPGDFAAGARPRQNPERRARTARRLRARARAPSHHRRRDRAHRDVAEHGGPGRPRRKLGPAGARDRSGREERRARPSSPTSNSITVDNMCETAEQAHVLDDEKAAGDFAI